MRRVKKVPPTKKFSSNYFHCENNILEAVDFKIKVKIESKVVLSITNGKSKLKKKQTGSFGTNGVLR